MQNERIQNRRKELKFSQQKLGDLIGVAKSTVSQWESGYFAPSGANLLALAKVLGVAPEWLTTGKNTARAADFSESNISPKSESFNSSLIPVLSYVQAGNWQENEEISGLDGNTEYINANFTNTESLFALYIKGDSMEPEFKEGDLIIVDSEISPCPGDYVVAKNGSEESTFKKYRPRGFNDDGKEYYELQPLNSDYPVMRSDMTTIKIIGVMVEHRRFRRR